MIHVHPPEEQLGLRTRPTPDPLWQALPPATHIEQPHPMARQPLNMAEDEMEPYVIPTASVARTERDETAVLPPHPQGFGHDPQTSRVPHGNAHGLADIDKYAARWCNAVRPRAPWPRVDWSTTKPETGTANSDSRNLLRTRFTCSGS